MASRRIFLASSLILLAVGIGGFQAEAAPDETAAIALPMTTGPNVIPPGGVIGFCVKNLADCATVAQGAEVVELTPDRRRDLEEVQALVNAKIHPRENPRHAWEYASAGYGDCNTYALEKRRELIARGWPRTSLLLASAVTETNEGHLVLTVRTSAGDLVLDNRLAPVVDWGRLPYRWVSRQSEQRLTIWKSILPRPVYTSANVSAKLGG